MRIQPIDSIRNEVAKTPVLKSRLKRLFDRPFNGVLRISSAEKPATGGEKDSGITAAVAEFEPSSVCLDKMVQNFIEDNNDKQSTATAVKYGRSRCNCFNANSNDSSDDELDFFSDSLSANSSFSDPSDTIKSLVPCASVVERNLLADASKIVERNSKTCKRKDDMRKIVSDGLVVLGYNASVCKSTWEKSSLIPAGEYGYIDVITDDGERILIDVDFRSEFEIARSTSSYRAILQFLPNIFVGKADRLLQIINVASEAARQSLKKKGMHIAPWRRSEYMISKWLAAHTRVTQPQPKPAPADDEPSRNDAVEPRSVLSDGDQDCELGDLHLIFGENMIPSEEPGSKSPVSNFPPVTAWQPPPVRAKSLERGNKAVVTGLASLLKEKL